MRRKIKVYMLLLYLIVNSIGYSQIKNIGTPYIQNYYPEEYNADTKSWAILQEQEGIMYFANHFGLLKFDGNNWEIVAVPLNRTFVRSIKFDVNGMLYMGCQNEFGTIKKEEDGQLRYLSLNNHIPEKLRDYGDVWQIFPTSNGVYFFTNKAVFKYQNDKIAIIEPKSYFINCFNIDDDIFLIDKEYGLLKLKDDTLELISDHRFFKENILAAVLKHSNEQLLICTDKNGLYYYDFNEFKEVDSEVNTFLKNNVISTGTKIGHSHFALGTFNDGVVILDENCKAIQHLNTQTGLQNNTIIALQVDKHENLWVSTGNGIDYALISSPFSQIEKIHNLDGEIYNTIIHQNQIYFATLNGIVSATWNEKYNPITKPLKFKDFYGPKKSVYNFNAFDDIILTGHHSGSGFINQNIFVDLSKEYGTWTFFRKKSLSDTIIAGTYNGFQLIVKKDETWNIGKMVKGFNVSSRLVEEDENGEIWMAHGYQGIYKISFTENFDSVVNYKLYTTNEGLPSNLFNNLFKINNEILIGTERGVYKYDKDNDKLIEHPLYKKVLGTDKHIRLLKEDNNKNIWYVIGAEGEDITGYLKKSGSGNIINQTMPFQIMQRKHIPGFENLYFYNNEVFIGTKDGAIHYNLNSQKNFNQPYHVDISQVALTKTDTFIRGSDIAYSYIENSPNFDTKKKIIDSNNSDILFSFSALFYEFNDKTQYSYLLEGYDNKWSNWNTKNEKEYTHLPGGNYTFKVKARNVYGIESQISSYSFEVDNPWYLKPFAFVFYLFIVLLIVYLINLRFKIAKKKLKLEELLKQREILNEKRKNEIEAENKIIRLKQDKLHEKLSSYTMSITQKNMLFRDLQKRIEKLIYISKPEVSSKLQNVLKEIESELEKGEQWQEFQEYFNKTHHDFLNRIQKEHPKLTRKDLKFCAYIRMKLNSKEIMTLMNITIRGVEAARLRLRKKLNLDTDTNLDSFIIKY